MNKIIELLKEKNYQIPAILLKNYAELGITEKELLIVIILINHDSIFNPKEIADSLSINTNNVLELVNSLSQKGLLSIDLEIKNSIRHEVINLDNLYSKLAFKINDLSQQDNNENIYNTFEHEFGRTLSPMEFEIINGWINAGNTEELILLALKEAVYNGVNNMRYIDRIIYEWNKKNIKNQQDVENSRKNFKKKQEKIETTEYDWLNDAENS